MFEPTATNPPIMSISDDQRQALRRYVGNCVDNELFEFDEPFTFVLVLAGDKPAATMQPSREEFPNDPFNPAAGLCRLCDQLNVVARKRRELGWWFIAPVEGRLDLLPSSNRTQRSQAWMRRLGIVLGYPPSAIETFLNARGQWTEPHELVAAGEFTPEEMADAGFVVYRHNDSVEGYEKAIRKGRRVRKRLEDLAEEWDVPEITTFIDGHWKYLREESTPKKATQ